MTTAAQIQLRWHNKVATIAHGELENPVEVDHGFSFDLDTQGQITFSKLLDLRETIAGKLDEPVMNVLIKRHPSRSEARAKVTVMTGNPLLKVVPYTGPVYESGRIPMGPYVDGSEAELVIADNTGVYGALFTGEPGGGKSLALETAGAALKASGCWHVTYLDGDPSGASSAFMNDEMPIVGAGSEDGWRQLEAIEAALVERGHVKNVLIEQVGTGQQREWLSDDPVPQGWVRAAIVRPTRQRPGEAWIIDELSQLTDGAEGKKFARRVLKAMKLGRKLGISIILATQSLLAPDYGGLTPLRGFAASKNLFAFRNQSPQEATALKDLPVAPHTLMEGGGYAVCRRGGDAVEMRTRYAQDMRPFVAGLRWAVLDEDTAPCFAGLQRDPGAAREKSRARLVERRRQQQPRQEPQRRVVPVAAREQTPRREVRQPRQPRPQRTRVRVPVMAAVSGFVGGLLMCLLMTLAMVVAPYLLFTGGFRDELVRSWTVPVEWLVVLVAGVVRRGGAGSPQP